MWYSSGTVSVTAGGTTVTGSGTAFLANVRIGDGITIQGSTALHEVIGIASNTSLTIRPAYAGTTGSGRQYATVPVLGYDKDLSDAFNDIRLNFGSTLSALQPWAYAATAAAARTELELGSAAIRNAIGTAPLYGRDSVVGTVSQSGGVPTGALVQHGSNSNGEFWRYAGGMQVWSHAYSFPGSGWSAAVGKFYSPSVSQLFSAPFSSAPRVFIQVADSQVGARGAWCPYFSCNTSQITASYLMALQTDSASVPVDAFAIGRWY